jgi:ankyrin repeat protein
VAQDFPYTNFYFHYLSFAMQNEFFKLVFDKNFGGIEQYVSQHPNVMNEGISLDGNPNSPKGHPLHRICDAVFAGKISDEDAIVIAKILLAHRANIDGYKAAGDNNTPLIAAASILAEKLGIFYIEQGADIFYADPRDGATALHWASYCGRDKLVTRLIEAGADINQRDKTYCSTPMGWALHVLANEKTGNLYHQHECVKLLVKAGADLSLLDESSTKYLHDLAENDAELKDLIS